MDEYEKGFHACKAGQPREANPHGLDSTGRATTQAGHDWDSGWLNGQTGELSDLSWRRHVINGGD